MSSDTIYLYLKTHNKTGLKYLGKTVQDPYTYKGSGNIWKKHINKHGYDVTTEILLETKDNDELREVGLKYSELWNIVESKSFANLKPEEGDGGAHPWSKESREKLSNSIKGRKITNTDNMKATWRDCDVRNSRVDSIKRNFENKSFKEKHVEQLRQNSDYEKSSKTMSKLKWFNNGIRNCRKQEHPGDGWIEGRIKGYKCPNKSKQLAGLYWWTDGKNNKRSKDSPGLDWYRGMVRNVQ